MSKSTNFSNEKTLFVRHKISNNTFPRIERENNIPNLEVKILSQSDEKITISIRVETAQGSLNIRKNLFLGKQKKVSKISSFLENIKKIVERNFDNDDFGILQLCKDVGFSRSQLHNKIKKETGLSTSIFLRSLRLEKAKLLLNQTELNISEVAYAVGFKDPSYFSRLFIEKYQITPSNYKCF